MAKMDEVQTMATLSLARQQQTDMRVDGVEQTANEAKALTAGAAAGEPAGNVDLAGLAGWAPKALSAWKTTAGGGSCAVCVPNGCVSYSGSAVPASKFHPSTETKLGLQYCSIPPAEGDQGGKLFLTVTVSTSEDSEGEVDGVYIEWAASESAARSAHSSGSVNIVACVLLVETVNGELQQRHTGNIILGATGEQPQQGVKLDEVSVDYKTAVDKQGNPKTHRETVDGVEVDVPEKTDELEVKGWHEDDPVGGSSLAELMGFPISEGSSNDIIVRDGGKGGSLKYYKVGQVDPLKLPFNPCRVVGISNGVYKAGTEERTLEVTEASIEVQYVKNGVCEGEAEGNPVFKIPVVVPPLSPPGNFEPVFVNGVLDRVGEGYWPFGRSFSNVVHVDQSAKIATGFIYLEISHPTSGSPQSALIKGVDSSGALPSFDNTSDKTKSFIPLYRIRNGAITIDFRSCMSLTVREL